MAEQIQEGIQTPQKASFWEKQTLVISFFVAVILSVAVYVVAVYIQHDRFVESQDRIVAIFSHQVSLPIKQQFQVNKTIQQQQEEQEQFHQEIKSLLDLEFNRIQNEFESFEIWAGIITIIFLIFSFYSLFKTEQFERQGKDTLDFIRKAEDEVSVKIKGFETDKEKELRKISGDFDDWKKGKDKTIEASMSSIGSDIKEAIVKQYEQTFKDALANLEQDFIKKSEARIKDLSDATSEVMNNQFEAYSKQFNELISNLKKQVEVLSHIELVTEEDIDEMFKEKDQEEHVINESDQSSDTE